MSGMAEVLAALWDAGNCTGLDGWVGPGRGAIETDDVALDDRRRDVDKAIAALSAAGFGPVKEAGAKALEDAADEMDEVIACGDIAEVAAPVEGSVGRPEAISNRDSLYEEPSYWLRARAADVRGEG